MKKIALFFILVGFSFVSAWAQSKTRPSWLTNLPESNNDSYYYRVTMAEDRTYEKAYAKAFAMAILESSWKIGVAVDTKADVQTLEKGVLDNINIQEKQLVLPLNKVCEYEEYPSKSMNVRLYILWQVASKGNVPPRFEPFNNCN